MQLIWPFSFLYGERGVKEYYCIPESLLIDTLLTFLRSIGQCIVGNNLNCQGGGTISCYIAELATQKEMFYV